MRLSLTLPLAIMLLALSLALGWRIAEQLRSGAELTLMSEMGRAELAGTGEIDVRPTALPAAPEAARLTAIEARPLFSPTRRPWPGERQAPAEVALGIHLSGIVVSEGESVAILTADSLPQPQRLKVGDSIAGWTLESILADRVVLLLDDERRELTLSFSR